MGITQRLRELLFFYEDQPVHGKTYATRGEARADVFDYIECFDKPKTLALDAKISGSVAFEQDFEQKLKAA